MGCHLAQGPCAPTRVTVDVGDAPPGKQSYRRRCKASLPVPSDVWCHVCAERYAHLAAT